MASVSGYSVAWVLGGLIGTNAAPDTEFDKLARFELTHLAAWIEAGFLLTSFC